MSEDAIKAGVAILKESFPSDEPNEKAKAAMFDLLQDFLLNVKRIADATEALQG